MPRENILVDDGMWKVAVGWSKMMNQVQIATLNSLHPEDDVQAGWFVELDRQQINDLINLLRKARDGALGKDA